MKLKIIFLIIFISFSHSSCAYKSLYKRNALHAHKINILVKSKDNYENNISMMKLILNERLNIKNSKPSNLKLIVSLERLTANLGVNKDIYSFGRMLTYNIKYSFYDKKGLLKSGNLQGKSSFNVGGNPYGNKVSEEDASQKIILSLAQNLSNIIAASNFKRPVSP